MRVLIVEDEIGLADAVSAILKREGYETDTTLDETDNYFHRCLIVYRVYGVLTTDHDQWEVGV